jgi:hypothetical protein
LLSAERLFAKSSAAQIFNVILLLGVHSKSSGFSHFLQKNKPMKRLHITDTLQAYHLNYQKAFPHQKKPLTGI